MSNLPDVTHPSRRRTTSDFPTAPAKPLRVRIVSDAIGTSPSHRVAPTADFDVVVAAGDVTASAAETIRLLRRVFPAPMPIVAVLGDRELAGGDRSSTLARAREIAEACGVVLLEDGHAVVGGVRYVGCTFWSDFRLHGRDVPTIERAFAAADATFRKLGITEKGHLPMDPYSATWKHCESIVRLDEVLRLPFAGPTVVITHHAPSALSLSHEVRNDPLAPTMASPRDEYVESCGAALWIHGHVPEPADYVLGTTRVVASPGGTVAVPWTTSPGRFVKVDRDGHAPVARRPAWQRGTGASNGRGGAS